MAALNLAAISRDMDRADAIQDFNAGFALLQEDYSSVVGELDELERLGASRYFAAWPMTRFGRTVAAGATVPPEAYDPVAFEMAQMGKRSRTFLAQLGAAADELARSPGASTPRLHQLVQDLNAATPEVLRSVHSLAQSIDRLGG